MKKVGKCVFQGNREHFKMPPIFFDKQGHFLYYTVWITLSREDDMLLVNTETGIKYPFTFEAVGACDLETLEFAIQEIKANNLPVTRIVTIVGLDELMEKGWIEPMLAMAEEANIRLIVPPISPLMESDGKLEQRWNYSAPEGAWLGTFWNEETILKCEDVLREFLDEYDSLFSLDDHFGVLVTDLAVLEIIPANIFAKVSVLCGTSNTFKAALAANEGADSINLVPMKVGQVEEIYAEVGGTIDVYIDPPRSICPSWYELDDIIALAPQYIEAGAGVLKAEGTETIAQLLDHDYLMKIAIPRQTMVFSEVMDACSTAPYKLILQDE
jgi:hypothetical protein